MEEGSTFVSLSTPIRCFGCTSLIFYFVIKQWPFLKKKKKCVRDISMVTSCNTYFERDKYKVYIKSKQLKKKKKIFKGPI